MEGRTIMMLAAWLMAGGNGGKEGGDLIELPLTRFELSNGLRVIVATKTDLPLTVARLVVSAGSRDEGEKWGLANLTGELLTEGTQRYTTDALADEIEFLGADIHVDVGTYTTQITLDILSPKASEGFDLLREVALAPTFPEDEIEKTRQRILASLQESLSDPNHVVDEAFRYALYGDHPQGRPTEGTPITLQKLTREDIVTFYRTFYTPSNAFLVVVSSLNPDTVKQMVEKAFGKWKAHPVEHPALPTLPTLKGKRVVMVPMQVNQAFVLMGHWGIRRSDSNYPLVRLMNYIVGGGGFASRLFRVVRNEKGYAYSVYSYFYPGYLLPGDFRAGMQTKIETANDAIASMLAVLDTFRKEGPTSQELADAKSFILGSLPRRTETFGQILGALVSQELYNLPDYYWVKEAEESQRYTKEDVQKAASQYLDTENFVLVLVVPESFRLNIPHLSGVSVEKLRVEDLLQWGHTTVPTGG